MKLVDPNVQKKWEATFASGSDKRYPTTDLVRLDYWHFGHPEKGRLLEYGHGCGVNLIHLLECGYTVDAMDASPSAGKMVADKLAKRPEIKNAATLHVVDLEASRLPFDDGTFDFVVCISVLSLLGNKQRVSHMISEFARVLKPGGKAILDINDSASDFARDSKCEGNDVYLYRGAKGTDDPVPCYCLPSPDPFVKLIKPHFQIDDVGFSAHKYFTSEINEFIVCCTKQ